MLRRISLPVLVASLGGTAATRETVPFNFGWRFYLGDPSAPPPAACNATTFPVNLTGVRCDGLTASEATTPADCEAAACYQNVNVWQFCIKNATECNQTRQCWIGNSVECSSKDANWVSGAKVSPTPGPTPSPSPTPPPAANPAFDDSRWPLVDAPHDALISTPYDSRANNGQGSIPKNVTFYRKHFVLPADWRGSQVHVYFSGVFSVVTAYFQGVQLMNHSCGYTSFSVRLDNASGVVWGGENVLAIYADSRITTGWWFEGGGLFRDISIIRSSFPARLADDGVYATAFTEGAFHPRATPADGIVADSATVTPSVSVEMDAEAVAANVTVRVDLYAQNGVTRLASSASEATLAHEGATTIITPPPFSFDNVELWSVPRPYLHVLVATLMDASGAVVDTKNITLGVRTIRWDAINGMFLNEQRVKLRGFCNHNNFAGVGMGVPTRVNLLRLQQIRAMGGNSWRMSHNPGNPDTFELGDRLGMTFLDENRVFSDDQQSIENMRDMVRRDRKHASILFYSFCNEAGCSPSTQPALDFKLAAYGEDGSRAVTMNYFWPDIEPTGNRNATEIIDVQGFSHQSRTAFEDFHETFPAKPIGATECCSCENQRDEDGDIVHNASVWSTSNTGSCQASQTNASDGIPWAYGTYVWTAHVRFHKFNSRCSAQYAAVPKVTHLHPLIPTFNRTTMGSLADGRTYHRGSVNTTLPASSRPQRSGFSSSG